MHTTSSSARDVDQLAAASKWPIRSFDGDVRDRRGFIVLAAVQVHADCCSDRIVMLPAVDVVPNIASLLEGKEESEWCSLMWPKLVVDVDCDPPREAHELYVCTLGYIVHTHSQRAQRGAEEASGELPRRCFFRPAFWWPCLACRVTAHSLADGWLAWHFRRRR